MNENFYSDSLEYYFKKSLQKSFPHDDVQRFLYFLMSTDSFTSNPGWKSVFSALFSRKNPEFLKKFLHELQMMILEIAENVVKKADEALLYTLWRLCAIVPFCDPPSGLILTFPMPCEGKYQLVDYCIEPIELTPSYVSPLMAYGAHHGHMPSLLMLKGTPPTTSQGCLLSIWTDFVPFMPIGKLAFCLSVRKRLERWLGDASAIVVGQSLGGSLALLAAEAFPKKIQKVIAFCPGGYACSPNKVKANVTIIYQANDIVPFVGPQFNTEWRQIVVTTEPVQGRFLAHVRVLTPFAQTKIVKARIKPGLRFVLRTCHTLLSIPIFLATSALLAIRFLVGFCLRISS